MQPSVNKPTTGGADDSAYFLAVRKHLLRRGVYEILMFGTWTPPVRRLAATIGERLQREKQDSVGDDLQTQEYRLQET